MIELRVENEMSLGYLKESEGAARRDKSIRSFYVIENMFVLRSVYQYLNDLCPLTE